MKKHISTVILILAFALPGYGQKVLYGFVNTKDSYIGDDNLKIPGGGLPGYKVHLVGKEQGVLTDADGFFAIRVPEGENVLEFNPQGYKPYQLNINTATYDISKLLWVELSRYNPDQPHATPPSSVEFRNKADYPKFKSKLSAEPKVDVLREHKSAVEAVWFTPDGKTVVTAFKSGTFWLRAWDVTTGISKFDIQLGDTYYPPKVALSSDGQLLAVAQPSENVKVYSFISGKKIFDFKPDQEVESLAFSPDSRFLALGFYLTSNEAPGVIWNIATNTLLRVLEAPRYEGNCAFKGIVFADNGEQAAAITPEGESLFSGGGLYVWNVADGRLDKEFRLNRYKVKAKSESEENSKSVGSVKPTVVYNRFRGKPEIFYGVRFASESSLNVIAVFKSNVSGRSSLLDCYDASKPNVPTTRLTLGNFDRASYSIKANRLALADGKSILVYDGTTGTLLKTLNGHEENIVALGFSEDGSLLASGSQDKTARIWDLATLQSLSASNTPPDNEPAKRLPVQPQKLRPLLASLSIGKPEPSPTQLKPNQPTRISVTLTNTGKGEAQDVHMALAKATRVPGLQMPAAQTIATLAPGASHTLTFTLTPDETLSEGIATLVLTATEANGFDADPLTFQIGTVAFVAPRPVVADHLFTPAQAMPKREARLEVSVHNASPTTARAAVVAVELPPNVIAQEDTEVPLGDLKPGESRQLAFAFTPNARFAGDSLVLTVRVSEKTGRFGSVRRLAMPMQRGSAQGDVVVISPDRRAPAIVQPAVELVPDVDKDIPVAARQYPNRYALIIGNEHYTQFSRNTQVNTNVPFAERDAAIFYQYATKTLGIRPDNCFQLIDATAALMRDRLQAAEDLVAGKNGRAELFVYYAGHGIPNQEKKTTYLLPVDVPVASPDATFEVQTLIARLGKLKAKRVVVVLDACFSGTRRPSTTSDMAVPLLAVRAVDRIRQPEARGSCLLISACDSVQTSLSWPEKQHGLMSYYLFKWLKETRGDQTYGALKPYLEEEVNDQAIRVWGGNKHQNPQIKSMAAGWQEWKVND